MYCRCFTFCSSKRCGSMWQCVMFLMLNEDKDFGIRTSQTTNQTKRRKRRHLKQKQQQPVTANATTSTCLGVLSVAIWLSVCINKSLHTYRSGTWSYVWVCFECKRMCAGGTSSSVPPLRPHPSYIMTDNATWPGENPRLTIPCYLSFRSALETTRDSRRAFRESTTASLCIPSI